MPEQIITQEGYDKLQKELEEITTIKRKEIATRIQTAKDMGDLSENAEYSEAKDAQAFNEGRIAELKHVLKNLTIVKNDNNKDTVGMGSKIKVESNGKKKELTIVSFNEADPVAGKISNESPLGKAFLNKNKGANVSVETPKGIIEYKILDIL
jgi:transcription elongation factor GreA